ncbi:MAG: gephyrin-like molybdotransferase Glp [Sandaracinus sp.]
MKTIGEALAEAMALVSPLPAEERPLADALGGSLADDLVATLDVPWADVSLVDGYAVRAADVRAGVSLRVSMEARAGADVGALEAGTAGRIFTGAPLPHGADAVVMQEIVTRVEGEAVFSAEARVGQGVRRAASDLAAGERIVSRGTEVDPGLVGLAASQGRATLPVVRAPRVAILTTGDELRDPGDALSPGAIYDANGPMLTAAVQAAGGRIVRRARVPDDLEQTRAALDEAARAADLVVIAGGVSVGDHDLVHAALAALGVRQVLWKVRMKPGKPLAVGVREGRPFLGLPGNPVSAWVGFELFVRPMLRRMLGDPRPYRAAHEVVLGASIRCSPDRTELARARLDPEGRAWPLAKQTSSALGSVVGVDALLVLPERDGELAAGERVHAMRLFGHGRASSPFA